MKQLVGGLVLLLVVAGVASVSGFGTVLILLFGVVIGFFIGMWYANKGSD